MEFIKLHDSKVKIMLTQKELMAYGLTAEGFDGVSNESRAALRAILKKAEEAVGFVLGDRSAYVELYSSHSGDAELFVTAIKPKHEKHGANEEQLYAFHCMEDLLSCAAALLEAGYRGESAAYRFGKRFYLALLLPHTEALSLADLVSEFGRREELTMLALLKPSSLCQSAAVEQLGQLVCHGV